MNGQKNNDYEKVRAAISYLSTTTPNELDLGKFSHSLGLSERQLVELFQRWCSLTPKSFAQAVALDHAKTLLKNSASVLDTAYEVGLSSPSRLHDLFVSQHAMPPGVWANRGAGLEMKWGIVSSPFGDAIIFLSKYGVTGLGFVGDFGEKQAFEDFANRWPEAGFLRDDAIINPVCQQIFRPELWKADQPVRIVFIGTDFEIKVWQTLLKIPFGEVSTYGKLANSIEKPKAARAVGAAIGRNPISFVVPCHRVVGATGNLTGYHWGITRKRAILGWESGQKHKIC